MKGHQKYLPVRQQETEGLLEVTDLFQHQGPHVDEPLEGAVDVPGLTELGLDPGIHPPVDVLVRNVQLAGQLSLGHPCDLKDPDQLFAYESF